MTRRWLDKRYVFAFSVECTNGWLDSYAVAGVICDRARDGAEVAHIALRLDDAAVRVKADHPDISDPIIDDAEFTVVASHSDMLELFARFYLGLYDLYRHDIDHVVSTACGLISAYRLLFEMHAAKLVDDYAVPISIYNIEGMLLMARSERMTHRYRRANDMPEIDGSHSTLWDARELASVYCHLMSERPAVVADLPEQ